MVDINYMYCGTHFLTYHSHSPPCQLYLNKMGGDKKIPSGEPQFLLMSVAHPV